MMIACRTGSLLLLSGLLMTSLADLQGVAEQDAAVQRLLINLHQYQEGKDVVFLLDASAAVSRTQFYLQQVRVVQLMVRRYLEISPGRSNIAVLTHGHHLQKAVDYISAGSPDVSKCEMVETPDIYERIRYQGGDADLDAVHAYDVVSSILGHSRNPQNPKFVVHFVAGNVQFESAYNLRNWMSSQPYASHVYAVVLDDVTTDQDMRSITEYYAEYSVWKKHMIDSDFSVAYHTKANWIKMEATGQPCDRGNSRYCDVISGYSKCMCDPGFTKSNGDCKPCVRGTFKAEQGDGPCERCPTGADPNIGRYPATLMRDSCICLINNHYRSCADVCLLSPLQPSSAPLCAKGWQCKRVNDQALMLQDRFTCNCPPGRQGVRCNQDLDDCTADSCANGGICVEGTNQYTCLCPLGYTGKRCQTRVDYCASLVDACAPDASCHMKGVDRYVCICRSSHSGSHCLPEHCLQYDCYANGTIIDGTSIADASSGGMSDTTKLLVLVVPLAAAIIVMSAISIAAILHAVRKGRLRNGEVEADVSCHTETTSVISRNPSLLTFDSKCYKDEGTPVAPPVDHEKNFYGFNDAVYGNEPLQKGMDEWYEYVLNLVHNNNLTRVTIVRLDGEKWVLSPGCRLSLTETQTLYNLLSKKLKAKLVNVQGREFGIVSNDDYVLVAHSVGEDGQEQEVMCATKTRQFVIMGTSAFQGDHGRCCSEINNLRDHVKKQGL